MLQFPYHLYIIEFFMDYIQVNKHLMLLIQCTSSNVTVISLIHKMRHLNPSSLLINLTPAILCLRVIYYTVYITNNHTYSVTNAIASNSAVSHYSH